MKSMLALMAGAMVFAACSNDDTLENINEQTPSALKPMIFTASMEGQGGGTRAAIDGLDINWTSGDKISIFDGSTENNGNQEFTLSGDGGSTSGSFTGTAAEATTYYALYPYAASSFESKDVTEEDAMAAAGDASREFRKWEDRWETMYSRYPDELVKAMNIQGISQENQAIILAYLKGVKLEKKSGPQRNANDQFEGVVLPAQQIATAGSADPKAMLMIAKSDDASTMEFKNVCAFVKVKPTFDCTSILIKSKGTESLAGTLTVDYNEGAPTTTVTADGTNAVTLTGTITANNTYYIAVRPETLASGFSIYFITANYIYKKTASKEVAFTRNNVTNLGSFEASKLTSVQVVGTAKATIDGVATDINWIQLWDNGPKFAEYNVGVTDGKSESVGSYFTWSTDIAKVQWGNSWRMPTSDEFNALLTNCTYTNTTKNNVSGLLFTGKDEYSFYSIFLPLASHYYWSATQADGTDAYRLTVSGYITVSRNGFSNTYNVRAVLAE